MTVCSSDGWHAAGPGWGAEKLQAQMASPPPRTMSAHTHIHRGAAPCRRGVTTRPRPNRKQDHHPDSSREIDTCGQRRGANMTAVTCPQWSITGNMEDGSMGLVISRQGLTVLRFLASEPNHPTYCVSVGGSLWQPVTATTGNRQITNTITKQTKSLTPFFLTPSLLFSLTAYHCYTGRFCCLQNYE